MKRYRTAFFSVLFWIISVAFFALVGYYLIIGAYSKENETADPELNVKWYMANNIEIDPDNHTFYSVMVEDNTFSIYHEADNALSDARLAFEAVFIDAEIFLNDKSVYSTKDHSDTAVSRLFTFDAPTPELHFVDFGSISRGDVIRADVQLYYNDGTDGISRLLFGNAEDVSEALVKNDSLGFFLCTVLFSFGVIMLVVRLASRRNVLTLGLEYIALFAFLSTVFSLLRSLIISMDTGLSGDVTYILSCLTFMLMFLPLILFFAENMTFRSLQNFLFADFVFQVLCVAASVILSIIGTANLHTTHFYAEIIGIVQFLIILILLIADFTKKIERRNSDLTLLILYVIFLAISVTEQLFNTGSKIPIMYVAGCLFFIVSITVVRVRMASATLQSVTETEKIGKLAFEDGLTGVGNTAAFRKKLSHLEVVKINYKTIGIVQFDINNLKTINDTLGHEMGDKLITDGSSMISRIFGKIGDVYRTGGDEFVAVICGDKADILCDKAINDFEAAMDEYNSDTTHKFMLQVAYGVEYYRSDTDRRYTTLRQIQKMADEKMYKKKREMKDAAKKAASENGTAYIDQGIR